MNSDFRSDVVRRLRDQQIRFTPRQKKLEQANLAERLLSELEDHRIYTYEYLCFRITNFRPDSEPDFNVSGADAKHDLRLFVEDMTESANLHVDELPEPVRTVEELSQQFNVSTKTISRWREHGLVSRRFVFDGRKRVGFLQSSVDRFVARNPERIRRGERFSQLTSGERDEIVYQARKLAAAGECLSGVTRKIAQDMGRSVETIRYTLKQFDEKHPDASVFPNKNGPLSDEARDQLYKKYRLGESIATLARQFRRTRSSIHRIISEMRAQQINDLPLDYMYHESFDQAELESTIMGPMPQPEVATRKPRVPSGLPPYLAALYEVPLLTREQEQHVFRKMNYLKHRAAQLRETLDVHAPKGRTMDRVEEMYREAIRVKNEIVRANLRLVVSIAKRHVTPSENFFELVSDGNMSLIRAVEKFDFSRGNKFSTYASWAIMKNFARTIPDEFKHRDRYRTSHDEMFSSTVDVGTNPYLEESTQLARVGQIGKILTRLDEREQKIIVSRFGLNHKEEPQTLKEVGEEMGVTKERVRQIEARALSKLRLAAVEERIDLPN